MGAGGGPSRAAAEHRGDTEVLEFYLARVAAGYNNRILPGPRRGWL